MKNKTLMLAGLLAIACIGLFSLNALGESTNMQQIIIAHWNAHYFQDQVNSYLAVGWKPCANSLQVQSGKYAIILENTNGAPRTVPEPTTFALVLLGWPLLKILKRNGE